MKVKNLSIYKHINENFRDYALYTLESRGIPNWYDGLTNLQRIAILNAPSSFSKTISLVGKCIEDNYHHGDCLHHDTEILLADNNIIKIGEWYEKYPNAELVIMSYDEHNKKIVYEIGHSPRIGQYTSEIYEILLNDNEIIKCTGNHPWYTNRGWVKTNELNDDDEILNI